MKEKLRSQMRILVTNDDGIDAPGLDVAEKVARSFTDDVWVVAPQNDHSGASHAITLKLPVSLKKFTEKRYSVSGTPADCVIVAVNHLFHDHKPDLIISGTNSGINIADDVTYSGTIAAAMEGCLNGIPSIALSLMRHYHTPTKWHTVEECAPPLIEKLITQGWPSHVFLNINFPPVEAQNVAGVKVSQQGKFNGQVFNVKVCDSPRENDFMWITSNRAVKDVNQQTDISALQNGFISVTPLHLDLTHYPTCDDLKNIIS